MSNFDDFFGLGFESPKEEKKGLDFAKIIKKDPVEFKQEDFIHKEEPSALKPNLINAPLDRYGKCPHCAVDWNLGDILENLKKIDTFYNKSDQEIVNIAYHGFGYSAANPKNFSKVIAVQIIEDTIHSSHDLKPNRQVVNPDYYMCPNCKRVWDANNGQPYDSILHAKRVRNEHNSRELDSTYQE